MLPIRLRRCAYAIAALLLASAVFNVLWFPTTDWYASAVLESASIAAIGWCLLILALEIAARFARAPRSQWLALVFAIVAVVMVAGYVFMGAWFGRENARFDTWHLLPLFTMVQFVLALIAAGAIVGIIALVAYGLRRSRGSAA